MIRVSTSYAHRPATLRAIASPATANAIVGTAGAVGATAATAAVSSIAAAGGSILGIAASSLVPVVGPAIGLAVFAAQRLIANSGCGQTCIVTSQWANEAAAVMEQNLHAYFALPAPRPRSAQIVVLATFDDLWARLVQQCGDPSTGDAGKACISDRQAGACKWRQNQEPTLPGEPRLGECWNWFNGMRDPIAQDANTYDDTAGGLLPEGIPTLPTVGGIGPAVWVPALAIALGVALL